MTKVALNGCSIVPFSAPKGPSLIEYMLLDPGKDASQQPTPEHMPSVATAGCPFRHDELHITIMFSESGSMT
jgi:hypothetical protein